MIMEHSHVGNAIVESYLDCSPWLQFWGNILVESYLDCSLWLQLWGNVVVESYLLPSHRGKRIRRVVPLFIAGGGGDAQRSTSIFILQVR